MNETSTDGSPIANSQMSDLSGRSRKQRVRQACRFRNFEMAMTCKGADAEHSILSRDERQLRKAVDVYKSVDLCHAQVEQWN
jgi:hypothetical protein